jgi:hypothetical protein
MAFSFFYLAFRALPAQQRPWRDQEEAARQPAEASLD